MQLYKKNLCILISVLALTGCNQFGSKHVKCDDEKAMTTLKEQLAEGLDAALAKELKSLIKIGAIKDLDPAKLKASAKTVQFNLADNRTDFIDPNSPKTHCSLDLSINISSDLVKKSDEARKKVDEISAADQIDEAGLKFENNQIKTVLEYQLQPTNKGDKTIVILKNNAKAEKISSDILLYAFLKPQIEKNLIRKIEENKRGVSNNNAIAAQQQAEYAAAVAVDAATEATYAAENDSAY
ncbi:hypothetical protein QR665_06555 [Acinetobacter gerneri]|uniref:hypothetical protein n=1 Tax=Acinetobacter gerneri TaxID=202952 RepID=UPI002935744C|nr:hypothetical protein [Acinetobacter gerneri]MDV2439143.1 hypothetical protein [Acinetobacter gerneri]